MQPRQLVIVAVAVLVAFGAAFGISKAGGGSTQAAATAAKPAEVIKTGDATVAANVSGAGALPALQVPQKKKPKKSASTTGAPTSTQTPAQTATPNSTSVPTAPRTTSPTQSSPPSNNGSLNVGGGDG